MKKVLLSLVAITLLVLGLMSHVTAQAPQSIFYQAVAHDAANHLLTNHQVCVRFTVHDATGTGTIIYQEKQLVSTDMVGAFSANIGQGTVLGGTFNGINWSNNKKYLQVDIDLTAQCTGYTDLGTTELISVPFALYAGTTDSVHNAGTIQLNADWNAGSGLTQILNKPSIPVFPPTGGTALQYINGIGQLITFPTNVSTFTNDAGYLTNVTANGLFIQNSTTPQSSANFNIDGSGTIANNLAVGANTTVTGTKTVTNTTNFNGGVSETGNTNITTATAGNVVINDPTPPVAAVVDVASSTQGFLPPRMTTVQRDAITVTITTTPQLTSAQGLTIYNLDTHCIETFVGTHTPANLNWQPIGCGCTGPPAAPGTIAGADTICAGGSNVSYAVPAVPATNYLYTWTLPAGATIVSGTGTDSITVSYAGNAVSGNISVTAGNSCGTGTATTLAVVVTQTSVAPANLFARPTTICSGDSSALSQNGGSLSAGATWSWYSDPSYTNFVGTGFGTDATLWVHPTQTTTYYLQGTAGTGPCGAANVQGPQTGVTVTVIPGAVVTAPSGVCIGGTAQLTPATGGTWTSSDNNLATVDNNGVITGVAAGNPTFTFTTTAGCSSTTPAVTVNAVPVVNAPAAVCIGGTAQLTPATGGTWVSSDNTLATVDNSGLITGVATGNPTFTFTSTGGCNSTTTAVAVSAAAVVSAPASVCAGATAQLTPTTGGTWTSSDNTLATVDNSGLITGVAAGTPTFTFTAGGCSTTTRAVTVNPAPVVSAPASVCIGSTVTLSPTTDGTWVSSDNSLATVDNSGVVTGIAAGNPTFTFTLTGGCSNTTAPVAVSAVPVVTSAPGYICAGSSINLTPSTGGTWVSSDNTIAIVTNGGVASAEASGNVTFTFTSTAGCSNTTSLVSVLAAVTVNASQPAVCVGGTIGLSPTAGTWVSSDNSLATVDNNGTVTGIAPGTVTFTFTTAGTGCQGRPLSILVQANTSTANAGAALSDICKNSTSAALGGSVGGGATGGVWSDGGVGGTFNSGATNLNTTWTPPANYTGTATLTLTTTGGQCGNASASKTEVVSGSGSSGSQTFNYTGGVQHFTVSSNTCATTIIANVMGAQGGSSQHNANSTATATSIGGKGGQVLDTFAVTPGQVLDIYVGGMGGNGTGTYPATMVAGAGGYNGGGNGGAIGIHFAGGGGGGASDIRTSGGGLGARIVVAGGGGGGGNWTANLNTDEGGPGGGITGGTGFSGSVQGGSGSSLGTPGGGGTQSAGGAAGYWMAGYGGCTQAAGSLGNGGATCNHTEGGCGTAACQDDPGGGGGGGYYGGGAATQGGGGGGSSYPATGVTHTQGFQTGNGQIIISW